MKTIFVKCGFFLLLTLLAVPQKVQGVDSPAKAGAGQRLKTIIVNNYHPYTFMNDKGEPDGFSVEIARSVTKTMDLELEIRADKWDVAMKELEAGGIDLLPMMAFSTERDKKFDFSIPHTIAYDAIFLKKGSTELRTLKDLSGKTVIVMNRDIAHSYLLTSGLANTMNLTLVDSLPEALKQLAVGKGDAAIMPKLVGIVTAKKLNLSEIETSPQLIGSYTRPFSFAVKEGNQPLLERLNQGLNIIKSTGEYDVIYKKWFGALEDPHLKLKTVLKYGSVVLLILLGSVIWNVMLKRQVKGKTEHLAAEIAERKMAEDALRESEERLQLATSSVRLGIWDWNVRDNTMLWDDRMFELYGITRETFSSNIDAWLSGLHPEDKETAIAECQAALKGEKKFDIVFRVLHPDGTVKHLKADGLVIRGADGTAERMLGINVDITERRQIEQELQNKNNEMERFTYTVSHDLKSPLITIQAYAGMIAKDMEAGKHDRARNDLKRIEDAASKMNALLVDLLELSRAGRQMSESSQVDINRLVKDTLEQLAGSLKQHQVEVVVQSDLPAVHCDQKRIAEVLQNLIENAIKYRGNQTAPRIEIGTRQDGKECVFFVKDNGAGIDPLQHERIFGLFKKLDTDSEGTGIGLALVKRIIEVHGGRVWVESAGEGEGSCFCFTIGS